MEAGEQQTMVWRHVANNIQSAKERELFNTHTHTLSDLQKRRAASTAVVSGRY